VLPFETVFAAFPPSVDAGGFTLRSPTLLHAVALESMGVDMEEREVSPSAAWTAAWVLSLDDPSVAVRPGEAERSAAAFMQEHADADQDRLVEAVKRTLGVAVSTFVPGRAPKDAEQSLDGLPDGFGWPIEVAELIAHEHGIPFADAIRTPCVTAFAIVAMVRARNGEEFDGPDYYGRIKVKRQKDALMRHAAAKAEKDAGKGTKEAKGNG
jgi:hypothetical protein